MHRLWAGLGLNITCESGASPLKETETLRGYLYIGNDFMYHVAKSKLDIMFVK